MSIAKVSIFCCLLLAVTSASLVALRSTDWNEVGLYTIDKTSGIVAQTSTWAVEFTDDHPLLAKSSDSTSLIYFELNQQELSGALIDTKSGDVLKGGFIGVNIAPFSCGGLVYTSQNNVLFSCTYGGGFEIFSLDLTSWKPSEVLYTSSTSQPLFAGVNPSNTSEYVLVSRDQKSQFLESDHVTVFNTAAQTSTICKAPFKNSTISQPIWHSKFSHVFLIQYFPVNSLGVTKVSVVSLSAYTCQWNVIATFDMLRIDPSSVQFDAKEPNTILWTSPDSNLYSYDINSGSVSGALLIEQSTNNVYSFAALLELP